MPEPIRYIKKIKLSDGSSYIIKDPNALPLSGGNLTGDLTVDTIIRTKNLYVIEIEEIQYKPENVLVQDENSGEIKKRSTEKLLEDIGGVSYSMDNDNGILSLKYGKQ